MVLFTLAAMNEQKKVTINIARSYEKQKCTRQNNILCKHIHEEIMHINSILKGLSAGQKKMFLENLNCKLYC